MGALGQCLCAAELWRAAGLSEDSWKGCPFPTAVRNLRFGRGEHLYHQGDPVEGAFSLLSGLVVHERVDENGELVILRLLSPGSLFPYSGLFGPSAHHSSARALSAVTVCFVPTAALVGAVAANPRLGLALLQRGCEELRHNEDAIFRLCCNGVPERLMAVLESLAERMGERLSGGDVALTLPVSWRELAAMVGSGPEVVSRQLRRLSGEGRLSYRGHRVVLHRTLALRACS
jgi:CRP/FNR family transcriptional regulator